MTRYFFHTQSNSRITDAIGIELKGPHEARKQAVESCGELLRDGGDSFWGSRPWSVIVTDEVGLVLWELSMDGAASAAAATLSE